MTRGGAQDTPLTLPSPHRHGARGTHSASRACFATRITLLGVSYGVKLPNGEQSRVDREKVTDYLLSATHPEGSAKAEFFSRFGFRLENWVVLADALRKHGASHPVAKSVESSYGTRYALEGELESPDGRNPRVRTVWVIERGTKVPRLITAYAIDEPL